MGEARLGVTDMIDKIARLPGLQRTFDKVAFIKEKHVLNARRELHEMAHSHGPDGIKTGTLTPQAFCELLRVSRVAPAHLRVFCARANSRARVTVPEPARAQVNVKLLAPAASAGAKNAISCKGG